MLASVFSFTAIVRRLFKKSADAAPKTSNIMTPLEQAVMISNQAGLRLLLEKGADIMTVDNKRLTAPH